MTKRLKCKGLKNTRDLGGYYGVGGRKILAHKLLRGEAMAKAAPEDIRMLLNDYRLKLVIDLRMDPEIEDLPDPVLPGVTQLRFNLLDKSYFGIARDEVSVETWLSLFEDPSADAQRIFSDMYYKLVFDDRVRPMIKEIFEAILECDGAALWHCSAGKDRAGVVTMLILYALGVSREDIVKDYLATERFTFPDVMKVRLLAPLKIHNRAMLKGANVLMGVKPDYPLRIFNAIDESFRDEFDFFKRQYDIPPALILRLRDKYLQ